MKQVLCCLLVCIASAGHTQQIWKSMPDNSSITFKADYDGAEFDGYFSRFSSVFEYSALDINKSQINTNIDITSVNTRSRDRDAALAEQDWFYSSKFPSATFVSKSINQLSDNLMRVEGELTIRDQAQTITFDMQWLTLENHQREARGVFNIDRRNYNVGIGEWFDDATIGFNVDVEFIVRYEIKE